MCENFKAIYPFSKFRCIDYSSKACHHRGHDKKGKISLKTMFAYKTGDWSSS